MKKMKAFFKTATIGGPAVILPATLLLLIFKWMFDWITEIIQPLTHLSIAKNLLEAHAASAPKP